ncbi:MAG: hypothetical protein WD266_01200 [Balneolales bacterium]
MNQNNRHKLTDHIREVLQDHEEPYVLGSWEKFERQQSKGGKLSSGKTIFSIAASVFLILSSLLAWYLVNQTASDQYVEEPTPDRPERIEDKMNDGENLVYQEDSQPSGGESKHPSPPPEIPMESNLHSLTDGLTPYANTTVIQQAASVLQPVSITAMPGLLDIQPDDDPIIRRYVQAGDIRRSAIRQSKKPVNFSVGYASLMNIHNSQADLGIGGGFYTDWNFAGNLALGSGLFIAQSKLKYSDEGSMTMALDNEATMTSSGDLASVHVDLVSMEVPLNFRYFITDQFSVSAGISSLAYLKEDYNYTFETQQNIQVFGDAASGEGEPRTRQVTLTESRKQTEPSLSGIDLAALYTFSIGYQVDIANRHTVSLEPFLKIPTGRMTSRDIKYTTGGLQMKLFF